MELLIYAGGRWRRVCLSTGRVTGWRRPARIVVHKRGVLRELSPGGRIDKGPPLPKVRCKRPKPNVPAASSYLRYDLKSTAVQTHDKKNACVQTTAEDMHTDLVTKPTQILDKVFLTQNTTKDKFNGDGKENEDQNNTKNIEIKNKHDYEKSLERQAIKENKVEKSANSNGNTKKKRKIDIEESQTSSSEDYLHKELIIKEEDVLLLRRYIETHKTSVDLYRFDIDDNYKTLIFYKINPLVKLERCPKIDEMIENRDSQVVEHFARRLGLRSVSSASGGNDSVKTNEKKSTIDIDTDEKANNVKKQKTRNDKQQNEPKKYKKIITFLNSDSDNEIVTTKVTQSKPERLVRHQLKTNVTNMPQKNTSDENDNITNKIASNENSKKTVENKNNNKEDDRSKDKKVLNLNRSIVMPKRSSVPPGREYSMLEDHAIVAWLSSDTYRERAVNGNRIWKDLETTYKGITGQRRSWHSLRNRYLRYILPSLGSLALPPAQAQRLRANATIGELKARKQSQNSILRLPTVVGASSRLRRPPQTIKAQDKSLESSDAESNQRETRSKAQTTPTTKNKAADTRALEKSDKSSDSSDAESNQREMRSKAQSTPTTKNKAAATRTLEKSASSSDSSVAETEPAETRSGLTRSRTPKKKQPTRKASLRKHDATPTKPTNTKSPRSSPSYSELTRRFALRNRSTPQTSPNRLPETHHKRRLYNPQRPVSNASPRGS